MRRVLFLYHVVVLIWAVKGIMDMNHCDQLGTLLYEDLGCKPFYEKGNLCPLKYICESFKSDNKTCLFRGKRYEINEELDDSLITENCFYGCKCSNPAGIEKFECGVHNCSEWMDRYAFRRCHDTFRRCYDTFEVDKCCSTGSICLNETTPAECLVEDKMYREGEIFIPAGTCSKCSCKKGFRGKIEEPFCKRTLCATQVVHFEELENFCAPLYMTQPGGSPLCCPKDWVCYHEGDVVERITPIVDPDFDLTCNFGPKTLSFGEGLNKLFDHYGMHLNVTCECILPPLLTCTLS